MNGSNGSSRIIWLLATLLGVAIAVVSAGAGHVTTKGAILAELDERYVPREVLDVKLDSMQKDLEEIKQLLKEEKP